jgi:phenylalanine-4-hydroxylase
MNSTIENKSVIRPIAKHLKQFIKPQDYSDYTPKSNGLALCDAQNVDYLSKVQHIVLTWKV